MSRFDFIGSERPSFCKIPAQVIDGLAQRDRVLIRLTEDFTATGSAHSAGDHQFSLFRTKSKCPRAHAVVRPWDNPKETPTSAEFSLRVDSDVLRDPRPVAAMTGQLRRGFVSAGVEYDGLGIERALPITVIDTEISSGGVPWSKERPWKWQNSGHRLGRLRPLDAVPLKHVPPARPIKRIAELGVSQIGYLAREILQARGFAIPFGFEPTEFRNDFLLDLIG